MILVGMVARLGGTRILTPECLHPDMAPPLASTRKLTKKLVTGGLGGRSGVDGLVGGLSWWALGGLGGWVGGLGWWVEGFG